VKAYRFQTGARIPPFDDPVSEVPVGTEPLGLAVSRALLQAGLDPIPGPRDGAVGDSLLLPDRIFLSRDMLRAFLHACPATPGIYRLGLLPGPMTEWLAPLARVERSPAAVLFHVYLVRGRLELAAGDWQEQESWLARRGQAVMIEPGGPDEPVVLPRPGGGRHRMLRPRSRRLVADISLWPHLVWLNQLLPGLRLAERRRAHRFRDRLPGAWSGRIGRGCDIHPTAWVENALLGDGVVLGPYASVRDCILGPGVELTEHSRLKGCCVGGGCRTLPDSTFIGCTFWPNSTLASFRLRDSAIGRRSFLTSGLVFRSQGIWDTVRVAAGGAEHDSGRWVLGSAAGHGCMLGTLGPRAVLAPGRSLPNGTVLAMHPEDGLLKLPAGARAGEPHICRDGSAQPSATVLPGWQPPELEDTR